MSEMLAENLSGMAVMGTDGAELGMLYNITMDLKTGELKDLIVEPHEDAPRNGAYHLTEDGRFRVPVSHVKAVKDHILIDR